MTDTSATIALTTPAEIEMWVLLSRRAQLHLQRKGLKTPGLIKWCKANIPAEFGNPTTADKALVMLNEWIAEKGGPVDPHMNYQVFEPGKPNPRTGLAKYVPVGPVFATVEDVAASEYAESIQEGYRLFGITLDPVTA